MEFEPSVQSRRRRLFGYAGRAGRSLLSGTLIMMVSILFDLLGPFLVGLIVDRELPQMQTTFRGFDGLLLLIGAFLVCIFLASVLRYAGSYRLNSAANRIVQFMQNDAFRHIQRLPLSYFDNLPAGTVVSRITNDTKAVRVFFEVVLSQMLSAFLYGIGILTALTLIDYRLMLLTLVAFPPIFLIVRDYRKKASQYTYQFRRAYGEMNGVLNETLQTISVIQALNREEQIQAEFDAVNDEVYEQSSKLSNLYAYSAYNITQALQYVMLAAVLIFFGYSRFSGRHILPIGHLYIFIDYMTKLFNQVSHGMSRIGDMERSFSAADHIFELLDLQPQEAPVQTAPAQDMKGKVTFDGITFAYRTEPVVRDISFEVSAGEKIAFAGATGSGKSTLMNLLLGFYRPQQGHIRIDDLDLNDWDVRTLRARMAIVLQEPYLFTGTVYSNISLSDPQIDRAAARSALLQVGGERFLNRLPDGLETPVNDRGADFSAGERQLITFARALVRDPRILVLDEATANIDSETEWIIQRGIERLSEGRTTFMIAHRLSTIREADQIMVLERGRIVERGTHQELSKRKGHYRNLLQAAAADRF